MRIIILIISIELVVLLSAFLLTGRDPGDEPTAGGPAGLQVFLVN